MSWDSAANVAPPVAQVDPGGATALADGTLLATWGQSTGVGGSQTPYVATTSSKGTAQTILDVAGATPAQPVVAAGDDGIVRVAAWKSTSGALAVLRWSRWTGSGWTPAATLLTNVSKTVDLDLQLSRDGRFGVLAAASATGSLFAFRFDGTTFGPADTIGSGASVDHPVVAVAGSAQRAILGWIQDYGGSKPALLGRSWNGSSWGSVVNISQEPPTRSVVQGAIAMSADGTKAMAAWRSQQAAGWTAAAATATGDAWAPPSPLTSSPYVALGSLGLTMADDAATAQVVFSARTAEAGDDVYVMTNRYAAGAWSGVGVRAGPFRPTADPRPSLAASRDASRSLLLYQETDTSGNKRARALLYAAGAWESPPGSSLDAFNASDRSGVGRALLDPTGTLGGAVWRQVSGGQEAAKADRLTIRTPPTPARGVTAEAVSPTAARVTWQTSVFDGNWPFPDYTAIADPGDGVPCNTISTVCVVGGLTPGRTYRFSVSAHNAEGQTPSQPSAAITMPGGTPPPPALGAITKVTVQQRPKTSRRTRAVRIRWSSATNATGYRIRVTRPGGRRWRGWVTQTTRSRTYRLPAGRRYRVSVQPVNGATRGTPITKTFRAKR